jgi:acetolactate synthase-1/2/3 large subunit
VVPREIKKTRPFIGMGLFVINREGSMKLTGAEIVCESLLKEGVDLLFGIPGGAVLPFYDALGKYPALRHVLVRHEQAASMAADGYARASGKVGVCTATSGPGATNLATGIAAAQMDSVPIVAITGQVPRAAIGRDAFQETDLTGLTLPITKHNYLVMDVHDVAPAIKEAFYIARSGRPGPVLVDIPKDVLLGERIDFNWPQELDLPGYKPAGSAPEAQILKAAEVINNAHRPVILAGHGVIISRAFDELKELAEKAQIPVITTLLGISSFPTDHILNVGMPGMHGMAYASLAIDQADVVISLGARFDDRVTGRISDFAPNANIVHFDIDPSEFNKNVRVAAPVLGDLRQTLTQIIPSINKTIRLDWMQNIEQLKTEHPSLHIREDKEILPQFVMQQLSEITKGDAIVVTGVGQHQMWAAQHYHFTEANTWITSGGLGTMGFEVPAALGAKLARPEKVVWSVAGDGGFQMTMCDLATAVENNIEVKFAILNNGTLGMVRQLQDLFYENGFVASLYSGNPDFVKLAEAYGITGIKVTDKSQVAQAIQTAMDTPGPVIIDFIVKQDEHVFPMIPAGESVNEIMEEPSPESVSR